jgi:hypothetical protein
MVSMLPGRVPGSLGIDDFSSQARAGPCAPTAATSEKRLATRERSAGSPQSSSKNQSASSESWPKTFMA